MEGKVEKVKEVRGGLHSFLTEVDRVTRTSGFHYEVDMEKREIRHHRDRWRLYFDYSYGLNFSILVETDDGHVLKIKSGRWMFLDGEEVDIVETPEGSYTVDDIMEMIKRAIANWAIAKFFGVEYADDLLIQSTG